MNLLFDIIYWTFIISSISFGMCLLFFYVVTLEFNTREFIYIVPLGSSLSVFCLLYENKIYPFALGILYWIIYYLWIKGNWKQLINHSSDGYNILHKGKKDYNKILFDLDRKCPTCGYDCMKVDEIRCGKRMHYLFKCKECGTEWTGHFIQ